MMCQPVQAGQRRAGFCWAVLLGCSDEGLWAGHGLDCELRGRGYWEGLAAQAGVNVLCAGQ